MEGSAKNKLRDCFCIILVGYHLCLDLALRMPMDCFLQLLYCSAGQLIRR